MSYRWARKMEDKEKRISKNSNTTGFYQKQRTLLESAETIMIALLE